ncbi:hypothetical protein HPP92_011081 [Vanilla planifolia]|uniref:Pectinesterase inhibitor domain-containing protein n=1 Tax=Vanilla planifolia TaxID=51239 RepID=A0A835RBQ3_VANPL|nr:hypothetical protein HPP92_011081 [Vanilla planifolia]
MEKKKKLIVIISGAAIMLAAMVAMAVVAFSPNGNTASTSRPSSASPSQQLALRETRKMIKSFCAPTLHHRDCERTLLPIVGNSTDVKLLVNATFHVALGRIQDSFSRSSLLLAAEKDPNSQEALMVCKEVLFYGIDDLQRTIDRYDSFNVAHADRILDDARTWLSGALTYQHTCLEAFDKSGSPAEIDIAKALNRSISFTANGLNAVSEMERMTSGLQLRRKLLASENPAGDTGLPRWVSFGRRRLLVSEIVEIKPNATVAQDGSGDYATITEALAAVPKKRGEAFVIYIKEGVYKEKVVVNRSLTNVIFIGDGPDKSKISGELNAVDGVKTFHTATFAVMGDGFMARDRGFENTAGAAKHQAVAVGSSPT